MHWGLCRGLHTIGYLEKRNAGKPKIGSTWDSESPGRDWGRGGFPAFPQVSSFTTSDCPLAISSEEGSLLSLSLTSAPAAIKSLTALRDQIHSGVQRCRYCLGVSSASTTCLEDPRSAPTLPGRHLALTTMSFLNQRPHKVVQASHQIRGHGLQLLGVCRDGSSST